MTSQNNCFPPFSIKLVYSMLVIETGEIYEFNVNLYYISFNLCESNEQLATLVHFHFKYITGKKLVIDPQLCK